MNNNNQLPELNNIQQEFFKFDVTIYNEPFGKRALWQNYKHPETTHFQQIVHWVALEHPQTEQISFGFKLSNQQVDLYGQTFEPLNGRTFEQAVYEFWSK